MWNWARIGAHRTSAEELAALGWIREDGRSFLTREDGGPGQRVIPLAFEDVPLAIGRLPTADIALPGDPAVSRVHAELVGAGGEWILVDGGLSKNGTFVNGGRISNRRRLFDGDELRLGSTRLVFHRSRAATADRHTRTRALVLEELARRAGSGAAAVPPTDTEIALASGITVHDVQRVINDLCADLGIEQSDSARARTQLVDIVCASDAIGPKTA